MQPEIRLSKVRESVHVDAVDPEVHVAKTSRLPQRAYSSDQVSLIRETVEPDSLPASQPSSAMSTSSKSPVEAPLR